MTNRREIHERVIRAKSLDELADVYSEWAASYDSDLLSARSSIAHLLRRLTYCMPVLRGKLSESWMRDVAQGWWVRL